MIPPETAVRIGIPKGRMYEEVARVLADAGIQLRVGARAYRPKLTLEGFEAKIFKPQTIVEMLHRGSRDVGFAGADWVAEKRADVVEVLDLELDPVRVVAAAPAGLLTDGHLAPDRRWVIASEYERLTTDWIERCDLNATFVRSYGATEVFPPEDADCIVDNTASGSTLRANGLELFDVLLTSSTRLFANPAAMDEPYKRGRIEHLAMLIRSVLDARRRVILEINVSAADLERLVAVLPCMREPTVAPLHGGAGYAVKAAVLREQLPELIPQLKRHGGSDILVTTPAQIVP